MKPIAAPQVSGVDGPQRGYPLPSAVAAPINAAPQVVSQSVSVAREETRSPAVAAPDNELLALARSWDLWGGAAFVLFVVWMAVSSVFALA